MSNTIKITKDKIYKFKEENENVVVLENVEFIDEIVENDNTRILSFKAYSTKQVYNKEYKYYDNVPSKITNTMVHGVTYHAEWYEKNEYYYIWDENREEYFVHNFDVKFIDSEDELDKDGKYRYTIYTFMEVPVLKGIEDKRNYENIIDILKENNKNLSERLEKMEDKISEIYSHIGAGNNHNCWD